MRGFVLRRAESPEDLALVHELWAKRAVLLEKEALPVAESRHVLAVIRSEAGGAAAAPAGTLWWLPTGRIGVPWVAPEWRQRGIGSALLAAAVREVHNAGVQPWVVAPPALAAFFQRHGFAPSAAAASAAAPWQRLTLVAPSALLPAELRARAFGSSAGRLRLTHTPHAALAVAVMAAQARQRLDVLSNDLQPALYAQIPFVTEVRRLALTHPGRVPVRVLLVAAEPAVRCGHRLLELARQLTSPIHIRAVPAAMAKHGDQFLLADDSGSCVTPVHDPQALRVDFANTGLTRRLRVTFMRIWEQAGEHPALRRLFL